MAFPDRKESKIDDYHHQSRKPNPASNNAGLETSFQAELQKLEGGESSHFSWPGSQLRPELEGAMFSGKSPHHLKDHRGNDALYEESQR